jgi:hypothetical protein
VCVLRAVHRWPRWGIRDLTLFVTAFHFTVIQVSNYTNGFAMERVTARVNAFFAANGPNTATHTRWANYSLEQPGSLVALNGRNWVIVGACAEVWRAACMGVCAWRESGLWAWVRVWDDAHGCALQRRREFGCDCRCFGWSSGVFLGVSEGAGVGGACGGCTCGATRRPQGSVGVGFWPQLLWCALPHCRADCDLYSSYNVISSMASNVKVGCDANSWPNSCHGASYGYAARNAIWNGGASHFMNQWLQVGSGGVRVCVWGGGACQSSQPMCIFTHTNSTCWGGGPVALGG